MKIGLALMAMISTVVSIAPFVDSTGQTSSDDNALAVTTIIMSVIIFVLCVMGMIAMIYSPFQPDVDKIEFVEEVPVVQEHQQPIVAYAI